MGTNFYMMTRNKNLVEQYFPNRTDYSCYDCGYEIVDRPYLGYEIHICKRSFGWVPLFQKHENAYKSFDGLEQFYYENENNLEIYDEYERQYTFEKFKEEMIQHSKRKEEPIKWVYAPDIFSEGRSVLHTIECMEDEAELHIPIRHDEYVSTRAIARKKYKVPLPTWMNFEPCERMEYERDPDYKFDWIRGDFS